MTRCALCGNVAAGTTCTVCGAVLPDAAETVLDATIAAPHGSQDWSPNRADPWTAPSDPSQPSASGWVAQPAAASWAPTQQPQQPQQPQPPQQSAWQAQQSGAWGQPGVPVAPAPGQQWQQGWAQSGASAPSAVYTIVPPPQPPRRSPAVLIAVIGVLVLALAVVAALATGVLPSPLATPAPTTARPVTTVTVAVSATPPVTQAPATSTSVPTPVVGLGAWTPTCTSVDADAASLLRNLTGVSSFGVPKPSSVPGFGEAALAASRPLYGCPVAHSLKVRDQVTIATDSAATTVVRAEIDAVLRTVTMSLGATKVGRFTMGQVGIDEAKPIYVAVLGQPDKVLSGVCEISGDKWTDLVWGGLSISFDATKKGQPLQTWTLNTTVGHPDNITLYDDYPLSATLAQLKPFNSSVTASPMFGNVGGPYSAVPKPGLTYVWDVSPDQPSNWVTGGPGHPCE